GGTAGGDGAVVPHPAEDLGDGLGQELIVINDEDFQPFAVLQFGGVLGRPVRPLGPAAGPGVGDVLGRGARLDFCVNLRATAPGAAAGGAFGVYSTPPGGPG